MKKQFLFCLLLFISVSIFSQKVKFKKGIYYVNDIAYLQQDCKHVGNTPCLFSSTDGSKKYFSIIPYPYQATRKVASQGVWYDEKYTAYCYQIKFLDWEKEFWTKMRTKEVIEKFAKAEVLVAGAGIDPVKLDQFIKIYGEEKPNFVNINEGR